MNVSRWSLDYNCWFSVSPFNSLICISISVNLKPKIRWSSRSGQRPFLGNGEGRLPGCHERRDRKKMLLGKRRREFVRPRKEEKLSNQQEGKTIRGEGGSAEQSVFNKGFRFKANVAPKCRNLPRENWRSCQNASQRTTQKTASTRKPFIFGKIWRSTNDKHNRNRRLASAMT